MSFVPSRPVGIRPFASLVRGVVTVRASSWLGIPRAKTCLLVPRISASGKCRWGGFYEASTCVTAARSKPVSTRGLGGSGSSNDVRVQTLDKDGDGSYTSGPTTCVVVAPRFILGDL